VFAIFWLVGAVVFYETEMATLGMTYWESVYFCWVAILSIGYGDFSPHSGAGRCFFLIWSLIAVPTVTILASDLTGTVVSVFSHWSNRIAEMTMLPRYGAWRHAMERYPWLFLHLPTWIQRRAEARAAKERVRAGFVVGDAIDGKDPEKGTGMSPSTRDSTPSNENLNEKEKEKEREHTNDALAAGTVSPTLSDIAHQHDADVAGKGKIPDAAALARQLALAIRRTAHELGTEKDKKKYSYEEWAEFTRLIRFSAAGGVVQALREEEDEGLVEWDWIGML
jgi:potassium channel subfamily K